MTSRNSDDPDQILNCDPAAVAIRASKSYETLQKLKAFAQQLTKYVGLMEDAMVVDMSQDDDDYVATPPSAVARRPPAMVPRRRVRMSASSPTSETDNNNGRGGEKRKASSTATDQLRMGLLGILLEETDVPHRALITDTQSIARPLTNAKADSPQASARSVRARTQVATATPSPSQKRPLSAEEEESDNDEDDDEDYQPGERLVREIVASNGAISRPPPRKAAPTMAAATPSPKSKRPSLSAEEVKNKSDEEVFTKEAIEPDMSHRCPKKVAPGVKADLRRNLLERSVGRTRKVVKDHMEYSVNEDESDGGLSAKGAVESDMSHRRPRRLAPGVKADLKRSLLERSVGRTRKVLNEHLEYLGLTAKFNVPVVSKHGTRVSHLTFKSVWNDLPQSRDETLEWWLGEGSKRMALASPLDPSIHEQPLQGIPVFWATPNSSSADICHYVGNFRCIAFLITRHVVKLGKPRQALIELQFVKFDESMAQKIASIQ
jgi:hypothetical protein